ncbi:MAG TPA: glycosyltransferase [bacterium]|nr:glycosyltransferase [bacterium]
MEISVVIPTFNSRDVLRRTIQALAVQTFPRDAYEIVIADDGSTDGTAEMVADAQRGPVAIRYVAQANLGRSAARNRGARAARGRLLLFLDADIWATPTLLASHHAHYPPGTQRLGVQGRSLTHPEARTTLFMRAREITPDLSVRRRHNLSPVHIITRNFSVFRREFEEAGGFDEGFTGYGWEDIELAMRMQAFGIRFDYEPDALAYHYHVETFDGIRRKLRQAGEGAVYFWRKHGRSVQLGLFLEILPAMLPFKWLVFRTPLFMPLFRWLLPGAERRGWLLVANECYTELIWEAYYDGVFAALRCAPSPVPAPGAEPRGTLTDGD